MLWGRLRSPEGQEKEGKYAAMRGREQVGGTSRKYTRDVRDSQDSVGMKLAEMANRKD